MKPNRPGGRISRRMLMSSIKKVDMTATKPLGSRSYLPTGRDKLASKLKTLRSQGRGGKARTLSVKSKLGVGYPVNRP